MNTSIGNTSDWLLTIIARSARSDGSCPATAKGLRNGLASSMQEKGVATISYQRMRLKGGQSFDAGVWRTMQDTQCSIIGDKWVTMIYDYEL